MIDLWPEKIGKVPDIKAPVSILKEQATLLGKRTKNVVEARVTTYEVPSVAEQQMIHYRFLITSPILNYRYELFRMWHKVDLYPVTIQPGEEIMGEISPGEKELTAYSEDEFVETLKKIFAAQKTVKVINSLLALSGYEVPDTQPA